MRVLLLFLLITGAIAADAEDPDNTDTLPLVQLLDLKFDEDTYRAIAARGPAVFNDLVALLAQAEEERLSRILGSLGALAAKHEELLPKVLLILKDRCKKPGFWSINGVYEATSALEQRAAPLVPDLMARLDLNDGDGATWVIWSLGKIGEPALPAAERLAKLFGGMDDERIADALGQMGNGIAPIIRRLVDERPLSALQIVDELAAPTPEILASIRPLLTHGQVDVRALAVAVWCKQAPDDLHAVVKAAATDPANPVRLASTKYLSHLPDQDAGPLALALLAVDDDEVLANALWRIGSVGLPRASTTARVLPFVKSTGAKVRRCAVRALGELGSGLPGGAGFSDRVDEPADERVRNGTIAALRPLLTDPENDVVGETITALHKLGLADQEFRRWLLSHLTHERFGWSCANTLTAIGLGKDDLPPLFDLLRDPDAKRRQMAMHVARAVTPRDERVIDTVIAGLADPDPRVRGYAAVTLGEMGADAVRAYDALVKVLDDTDNNAAGWAAAALGKLGDGVIERLRGGLRSGQNSRAFLRALSERGEAAAVAVPDVIAHLEKSPDDLVTCLSTLGNIGKGNAAARAVVLAQLRNPDGEIASDALMAITDIGLDEPSARTIANLTLRNSWYHTDGAFTALLPWPEQVEIFLRLNPSTLHGHAVSDVIAGWQPADPAIRALILRQPDLPPKILALSGDITHLATLRTAKTKASGYGSTHIAAYARMLGDSPDTVVRISVNEAGRFRPASAWPQVNRRRMNPKSNSHGDGFTEIVVTGVVRLPDGSHPKAIRFVGLNDRMLLGKREEHAEKRVFYDAGTGRFALFSHVFAAYSHGEGKAEEEGPYQTGSLTTRLIADGAKPFRVVFYDEMPDVEITVEPEK